MEAWGLRPGRSRTPRPMCRPPERRPLLAQGGTPWPLRRSPRSRWRCRSRGSRRRCARTVIPLDVLSWSVRSSYLESSVVGRSNLSAFSGRGRPNRPPVTDHRWGFVGCRQSRLSDDVDVVWRARRSRTQIRLPLRVLSRRPAHLSSSNVRAWCFDVARTRVRHVAGRPGPRMSRPGKLVRLGRTGHPDRPTCSCRYDSGPLAVRAFASWIN